LFQQQQLHFGQQQQLGLQQSVDSIRNTTTRVIARAAIPTPRPLNWSKI